MATEHRHKIQGRVTSSKRRPKFPLPLTKEMYAEAGVPKPLSMKDPGALARWREAQEKFLDRATQAAEESDANRAKSYAIAAGIATEKVLLLESKPTVILAGLHENRHLLPDVLRKLAGAAEILSANGFIERGRR
jgi:hypothetical protein